MAQLGSGFGSGYSTTIDTRQTYRNGATPAPDSDTRVDAEYLNDVLEAIIQIETTLGANVQGAFGSLAARLEAIIVGGGGVGGTGLTNVVTFAGALSLVIPGEAHQQAAAALLYQLYDTGVPRLALQPGSLSVHPTTSDVLLTFALAQSGTVMVAAPEPFYVATFSATGSPPSVTIPGATHGLGQTYLLFQVYDTEVPAQAMQVGSLTVHPTSKDVTLTFAAPQSGTVILAAGAPRYVQSFTNATTVSIAGATHGFASANLVWQVYDAGAIPEAIDPQGLSVHPTTFDVELSFALPQSGAIVLAPVPVVVGAPVAAPALLSVMSYGAVGDGVTNDSPAIQAAFDTAASTGVRHVHFPPGDYVLGSVVTLTDVSIQVSGAGMEVTRLLVNNTVGGIAFVSHGQDETNGTAHHFHLHDLSLVAYGPDNVSNIRGTAVKVTYPGTAITPVADTPHATLERVYVRSQDLSAGPINQPHFTFGIHCQNVQDSRLSDVHVIQLNNDVAPLIWLENSAAIRAFRVLVRGVELLGGLRGLKVTGWVENIQVSDYEIVGAVIGIEMDGSASPVRNPALLITNGHLNGFQYGAVITNWTDIHITNGSLYTQSILPSALPIGVLRFNNCTDVTVNNSYLGTGTLDTDTTAVDLILFENSTRFLVTGNSFGYIYDQPVGAGYNGVHVTVGASASAMGVISHNTFALFVTLGRTGSRGIVLSSVASGLAEITITGNRFENLDIGIVLDSVANALVTDNVYLGSGLGCVGLLGTTGAQCIVRDNHPATRTQLPVNSATPSVAGVGDGLCTTDNTAPTTITNFLGGYEGMQLEVFANTGNTTVAHNAGMILQGAAPFVMSNGSILTLRRTGSVWREIARTTV